MKEESNRNSINAFAEPLAKLADVRYKLSLGI